MRILPIALIGFGIVGVLRHYGLIDREFMHLLWPLALIAVGVALWVRGPRWRSHMRDHVGDRWERRMHRHFGPGWDTLSEEERDRFRSGMREWRTRAPTPTRSDESSTRGSPNA